MNGDPVLTAFGALLGGLFGSFLNVCISRLPAGLSVVRPRSRCPKCEAPIAWYDNVPIVSWMVLRGRCRHCRNPISPMYPLVELAVAGVWGWMVWRYGLSLEAVRWAVFGTLLIGIAMTDAREFIIPHEFSFGGLAAGVVLAVGGGLSGVVGAIDGAIFGAGLVYLIGAAGEFAFKKEAMGGGDVAMMAMVGAFLGWQSVLATIFVGAVVGIFLHLGGMLVRRPAPAPLPDTGGPVDFDGMTSEQLRAQGYLPFGVSLAIAAGVLGFVVGVDRVNDWFAWYASMIGL